MNLNILQEDATLRKGLAEKSLFFFGLLYLPQYFTFKSTDFHKQYTLRLQDEEIVRQGECHFRESAKSTWASLIYPLWCIIFSKRRFIVLTSETSEQAIIILSSLIRELESNQYIISDFGRFYFEKRIRNETKKKTINDFITENGIRVMARGVGQSIRGLRWLQSRPDLLICDDLDSNRSVLNLDQRDKKYNWLKGEALPAINQEYGKCVVIGNMIHFDCVMARIKYDKVWTYSEVPIYKDNKLAWQDRYFWTKQEADNYNTNISTKEKKKTSIEAIKEDKGSLIFAQEYLLHPLSEADQLVKAEWLKYYNEIPKEQALTFKGRIDPAIKQKESSDYSAIIIGARDTTTGKIYITDGWQKKAKMSEQVEMIVLKSKSWNIQEFGVEVNAYQEALKQSVDDRIKNGEYVPTKGITTTKDKVSRLLSIQPLIERGDIIFNPDINDLTKAVGDPRSQGLIDQLLQFPKAPHDDLVDAFIGVVEQLIKGSGGGLSTETKKESLNEPLTSGLMDRQF